MITELKFIDRLRSFFGLKISVDGRRRVIRKWTETTPLPRSIEDKRGYITRYPNSVTLHKTARGNRYRFRGGNTHREDQDRLRVKKGDLDSCVVTGGAGVDFHGKHKAKDCAFLRPCERAVKLREGARVNFRNCLFYGFDPHTVLVAGNTRAEFDECVFVDCEWCWLPMRVKHGVKGPSHNVQGFFDQRGSKAQFIDCTFVDSGMGKVRHPDDEILYHGVRKIGRFKQPSSDHLGDKRKIEKI